MIGSKSLSNGCHGKDIFTCFVAMASCFGIVDEEGIDELKELSENENTKKSTEQWKNVFVKWATERGKEKNLKAYECVDLDKTLSQFYAEVRKESGEDYEPDSVRVLCKQTWSDTSNQNCTRNLLSNLESSSVQKTF